MVRCRGIRWGLLAGLAVALGVRAPAVSGESTVPLPNPSFEAGTPDPQGWERWGKGTLLVDDKVAHHGTRSLKVAKSDWNTGWHAAEFEVDGAYGQSYFWITFSAWVKADKASGNTRLAIAWYDATGWICNAETPFVPPGTADWTRLSLSALPPRGATKGQLFLRSDANTGTVWFDDLAVETKGLELHSATDPQTDRAVAPYRAFLKDHPTDALADGAQEQILVYLERNGKGDDLVTELERLSQANAGHEGDRWRLRQAKALRDRGKPDKAIETLKALLDTKPSTETAQQAMLGLAESWEQKGDVPAAVAACEKLAADYPEIATEALYRAAMAYHQPGPDGDYAKAQKALRKVRPLAEQDPKGADMVRRIDFALAECDFFLGNWDAALEGFAEVLAKDPASTHQERAHYFIGSVHYLNQRYTQALSEFEGLASAQEATIAQNGLHLRAQCLLALDRIQEADAVTVKLEALSPLRAKGLHFDKTKTLFDRGRFDQALAEAERLFHGDDADLALAGARYRVECLVALKRLAEAREALHDLEATRPDQGILASSLRSRIENAE
ncbi:MAG TPA: tetratricopeptide repeat protein [Armatimonadota bacterium]|jgi:tetratricopeptide (TPR) repeat protein